MATIEVDKLRNVGLLGHGGSGKTSLGEALLFGAGGTQRLGKVDDGSSVLDYEPEEIKRHISISTAFHSLKWKKSTISLVDTPGFSTFLPDTMHCMRAFSGAVFLLSPSAGLRVEAERLWAQANERNIRRLLFVSKMDKEDANATEHVEEILNGLEAKGVPLQIPMGFGENFKGVVDLLTMKAINFEGDSGKSAQVEIPEELKKPAQDMRVRLMEGVAETDDAMLEKYLEGTELSPEEIKQGIRKGVL